MPPPDLPRMIAVDPGHGGHDGGAVGPSAIREADVALAVAQRFSRLLTARGIRHLLTRDRDTFVSIQERCRLANRAGAELFLSIHCNAAVNRAAHGIETIHAAGSPNGQRFAQALQDQLVNHFPESPNRGLLVSPSPRYPRRLGVLLGTRMPAALVELEFISNPAREETLARPDVQDRYAQALAAAVISFRIA